MPPTHMTARPRRSYAILPKAPFTTYAISALDDAPRPTRRTRIQAAIVDGNAPSRLDYRTAAHSGFATSAASETPPLHTSPPPRSARLGSTTSTGRPTSTSSTLTPLDLQSNSPPPTAPLHPTVPDLDVQAAAAHLSNTLLNYSHSAWEHAQREDPLCDGTRRYIQLGCPQPLLTSLCDHIPSHQHPDPADIFDLAAKGRLIQGDHDTVLLVRDPVAVASRPDGPPALGGLLSMTPFASMCSFWPDRGSCMHATPIPPVISVLRAPSKCLNASTGGLVWKPARNGRCAAVSNARRVRPPASRFAGQSSPSPYPTALALPSVLTTLGPCR